MTEGQVSLPVLPSPDAESAAPARSAIDPALAVFLGVEAVAGAFYLFIARHVWFFLDEWDFFVDRRATSAHDLFTSHNGHWVTLPIIVYRSLYWAVGLRSYLPYQLLIVGAHLVTALLLRVVMRRAGVRSWSATVVAGAFVLFGTGYQNIVLAFQITMVGALVFGLIQLILTDHDGPVDRRDFIGLGAGLFGLMCSGVGVPMVVAVGIAALIRRGWRVAALHTIPLGAIYTLWFVAIGHKGSIVAYDLTSVRRFVSTTVGATFDNLGQVPGVGVLLGFILIAGFLVAWYRALDSPQRAQIGMLAAPTGLLVASLVFLGLSAVSRASVTNKVQSRYEHILAAMLLCALGVAIDVLGRPRKVLVPLLAVVLVGVPGNLATVKDAAEGPSLSTTMTEYRRMIATLPHIPFAPSVPPTLTPEPITGFRISIGWLLQAASAGKLPAPSGDEHEVAVDALRLSLSQRPGAVSPAHLCAPVQRTVDLRLAAGDAVRIPHGFKRIQLVPAGGQGPDTLPFRLSDSRGPVLVAVRPIAFRLVVLPHASAAIVCATPDEVTARG